MKIKHFLMTLALAAATLTATGQTVRTNTGASYAPADLATGTLANATTLTISGTWVDYNVTKLRKAITGNENEASGSNAVLQTVTFSSTAVMGSMKYLFRNCTALTSVKMPTATNSKAVSFYYAFSGCTALAGTVNLSGFTNITDMYYAFYNCAALQGVTMPTAPNTTAVSFKYAFYDCAALAGTVNLSGFTKISDMGSAFYYCAALQGVTMPTGTNSTAVSFSGAFNGCAALAGTVDLSGFTKISNMGNAFRSCAVLGSVTMPTETNTAAVSFSGAFSGCEALESIDLRAFTAISNMASAFSGCTRLTLDGLQLPATNTPPAAGVSFQSAFTDCTTLAGSIDLSVFTNIKSMESAFEGSTGITGVTLPAVENDAAVTFLNAFKGCTALKSVDLSKFTAISDMWSAFEGCTALTAVTMPTATNTAAVSFQNAFKGCTALKTVDLSKFTAISDMMYAFSGCAALEGVTMPATTENSAAVRFDYAFNGCTALQSVDLSKFTAISDMQMAFSDCTSLTSVKLGGALPATTISAFSNANLNCLVYVPAEWTTKPSSWSIIYIAGGIAEGDVTLTDNKPFRCPEVFTIAAGSRITYQRNFGGKSSGIGGTAAGWETLCLPFTPTEITGTNKAGNSVTLAPFHADGTYEGKGTEGRVPFWLRALMSDSYTPVTTIQPNEPYIIAMPNNTAYDTKFNVWGNVTFSATATADAPVTIGVTPEVMPSVAGSAYTLHSTYSTVPAAVDVYVINTAGTAFVANGGDALPFRPYVMANSPMGAPAQFVIGEDEGGATAIEEAVLMGHSGGNGASADGLRVYGSAERGALVVEAAGAAASTVDVVAIDGRTVRTVSLHEGVNVVNGLAAGVYVVGGQKAVVR